MSEPNTASIVLEHILINTYNADQTQRSQAEEALSQYLCKPGSLYHLIIFLGNPEIHRDLRYIIYYNYHNTIIIINAIILLLFSQAAGIAVKNKIRSKLLYTYIQSDILIIIIILLFSL